MTTEIIVALIGIMVSVAILATLWKIIELLREIANK
jgi:hypothetical protein